MRSSSRDFKTRASAGGLVAGWCSIPCAFTAEAMGQAGFDAVVVDIQHGLQDFETAVAMAQAIGKDTPVLCRVHWNEPGIVMKMLDAGFSGVICPMINTAQDARNLAQACRYPPRGFRSFGPIRAQVAYGSDYAATANDWISVLPMIETVQAMHNLDQILAVDGIDGVYIGPADLSVSMGYEPTLLPRAEVLDAIEDIRRRAAAAGKLTGIHCGSPEMVQAMHRQGFHMATLLSDIRFYLQGMADQLAQTRGVATPRPASSLY